MEFRFILKRILRVYQLVVTPLQLRNGQTELNRLQLELFGSKRCWILVHGVLLIYDKMGYFYFTTKIRIRKQFFFYFPVLLLFVI